MTDSKPQNAQLFWDATGQPLSQTYDDVYFSKDNGLAETDYVFLQQNKLASRWQALKDHSQFVIAETGFGTGLNFLAAWQLWQKIAPTTANLHFLSVEKFPLSKTDLKQALSLWPELGDLAKALINVYPIHLGRGLYRLNFGRVQLTLAVMDAVQALKAFAEHYQGLGNQSFGPNRVDAWFLDGFAPAKNPDMWQPALFEAMATISHKQTTVATFTAAGLVRRGLTEAGFKVSKVTGYGKKREMAIADGLEPKGVCHQSVSPLLSWMINPNPPITCGPVAVIGAGLAGAHTACALAERGIEVDVFDRQPKPGAGASGNPQGIVYAKLSPKTGNQGDFNLQALVYALSHYRRYWQGSAPACGVLQLAQTPRQTQQYRQIAERFGNPELVSYVETDQASKIAKVELSNPGLYFPDAGWLQPPKLCQSLLNHSRIRLMLNTGITRIEPDNRPTNRIAWHLSTDNDEQFGPYQAVVVANANDSQHLKQTQHLPTKPVRGQISQIAATDQLKSLRTVICGESYIAPSLNGQHCIGATFDPSSSNQEVTEADNQLNLEMLSELIPTLKPPTVTSARAALRCTTPDYLPIVGPVADEEKMDQGFASLRRNAKTVIEQPGSYHSGLYVNIGHGSRGLAYTPLCAQLLLAHMLGEPFPVNHTLKQALHPARFIIRDLGRNRR